MPHIVRRRPVQVNPPKVPTVPQIVQEPTTFVSKPRPILKSVDTGSRIQPRPISAAGVRINTGVRALRVPPVLPGRRSKIKSDRVKIDTGVRSMKITDSTNRLGTMSTRSQAKVRDIQVLNRGGTKIDTRPKRKTFSGDRQFFQGQTDTFFPNRLKNIEIGSTEKNKNTFFFIVIALGLLWFLNK